jgi:hypothetical protein
LNRRANWPAFCAALAVVALAGCGRTSDHGRVTPAAHDVFFLKPGGVDRVTVTVDLVEAPPSTVPVDICFLFDATGSMGNVFGVVRERAIEILESINSLSTNTAFSVATFTDYGGGRPWVLHQDITADFARTQRQLAAISLRDDYNQDVPEAYSRALHEARGVSWRPGARRYLVLFGDAPAHDPDFYGENLGVDPGRDGVAGTPDDLRVVGVVNDLKASGIAVLVLFDESKRAGRFWGKGSPFTDKAIRGFEYMAAQSGGVVKGIGEAREIPKAIKLALRDTLRLQPALSAPADWAPWTRISAPRALSTGTAFEFDVDLNVPSTAGAGVHRFPLIATFAGESTTPEIGYVGVTIRLGAASFRWRPVLIALYLLGITLAVIAAARYLSSGRSLPYQGHWPLIRLAGRALGALAVSAGLYAVWLYAPGTLPPFQR